MNSTIILGVIFGTVITTAQLFDYLFLRDMDGREIKEEFVGFVCGLAYGYVTFSVLCYILRPITLEEDVWFLICWSLVLVGGVAALRLIGRRLKSEGEELCSC